MQYNIATLKELEQEFLATIPESTDNGLYWSERDEAKLVSGAFIAWLEAREALPRIVVYGNMATWTGSKTYFIYKVIDGVKEALGDEEGYRMQMQAKRDAEIYAKELGLKVYWE